VTDWSPIASNLNYFTAVANVPLVTEVGAQLIKNLVKLNLTEVELIHLVGHSLGAHISGGIGMLIQNNSTGLGVQIPRISGKISVRMITI
jgi:pancreatic triacylglycerol lipase